MKKWWLILGLLFGIAVTGAIKLFVAPTDMLAINSIDDASYAFVLLFVIGAIIGFVIDLIIGKTNKLN